MTSARDSSDRDILPDTVKPTHYDLSLFDIELGGSFSFQGSVKITAKVLKSTERIILNSHQLKIHDAVVFIVRSETQNQLNSSDISVDASKDPQNTGSPFINASSQHTLHSEEKLAGLVRAQGILHSSAISYDAPKQRAIIELSDEIPASSSIVVIINFQGTMGNEMAGFYRSKYTPTVTPAASVAKDDEFHYMFSTQFESSDARRAFPCFDEPNLKATFDFKIEVPDDQVALSNMPVKIVEREKVGLKVVSFQRTPIMSTYLLAWAVGDFEYVEDFTERKYNGQNLPVRVYTTRGLKEQGRFALEHAHQIIDYFSEIFKIDYPLPKADMLAVHEFSHGAMENWGLITYRTSAVLFDEATSSAKYKNRIAYVVAHELAHQWFGNLVTMDWWSELWLNEGFATWVGWLATDKLHPDWNVWPQFVTQGMQTAFKLDALRGSHPIEVPVKDALDVDQIFDAISYLKGSSVIRMLADHLGLQTFLDGVSNYLKAHTFGNATTDDLWSALSHASGQDVNTLMDPWIRKIGYPVVTISEEPGKIWIKQARYLSTGDVKPAEDEVLWWIPLGLKSETGLKGIASRSLIAKEDSIRDVDEGFYKINVDCTGFYRTNYPPARLASFGKHIDKLSVSDKIGLVGDAEALALSGDATTSGLLGFLEGFTCEENQLVWAQITNSLDTVNSVFSEDQDIAEALRAFTLKLISEAVAKIGWEYHPDEEYLTGQLRTLLINTAGMNGNKSIIAEAQRRFQLYISGEKTAIHPNLRLAVFKIAIRYGGDSEYEAVKKEWFTTTSVDGKEIALDALGRIQDGKTLLRDLLSFMFSSVATQDTHTLAAVLAANPKTRSGLWEHITKNWEMIREKLGGNMVILDRFLRVSLTKFTDVEAEQDIASFFKEKDNRGYDRTLGVVSDTIRGRALYRARDKAILLEWLKTHNYA